MYVCVWVCVSYTYVSSERRKSRDDCGQGGQKQEPVHPQISQCWSSNRPFTLSRSFEGNLSFSPTSNKGIQNGLSVGYPQNGVTNTGEPQYLEVLEVTYIIGNHVLANEIYGQGYGGVQIQIQGEESEPDREDGYQSQHGIQKHTT